MFLHDNVTLPISRHLLRAPSLPERWSAGLNHAGAAMIWTKANSQQNGSPRHGAGAASRLVATLADPTFEHLGRNALAAALSLLLPGDSLTVSIDSRPISASGDRLSVSLAWRPDAATPTRNARSHLADALRIALPAYVFASGRAGHRPRRLAWDWQVGPKPLAHQNTPIGFVTESADTNAASESLLDQLRRCALAAPLPGHREHGDTSLDPVIASLLAMNIDARIELAWYALDLTVGAPGEQRGVHDRLAGGGLEAWEHDPRGHLLSCRVFASRTVPESLLRSLGLAMFHTGDLVIEVASPHTAGSGTAALSIVHRDNATKVVLPSPALLLANGTPRAFPAAPPRLPRSGTILGYTLDAGSRRAVRLPAAERSRHAYIVGATGTGKSTLLLRMLLDDIACGHGVMLVDPHGDLFRTVVARIPASRVADVVVLDAADRAAPFAFNVLDTGIMEPRQAASFVTNELLALFNALYDMRQCGGPIFESYFSQAVGLLMLASDTRPTLADLPRVFEDRAFLGKLLARCPEPEITRFWKTTALGATGDHALTNMTSYVVSKVNRLTMDAALRPIVTHPGDAIDLGAMMNEGRIVLVHLAKGTIGAQSARFLGMALMMRLMAATLGRASMPEQERRPFHVFVDEFQTLATDSVGTLLAEARKFGIGLTLASQTLVQLDRTDASLADIVAGNVGALVMTRLGPRDAHRLAAYAAPTLFPADLQALPSFHALGSFLARDVPVPPFIFNISPFP